MRLILLFLFLLPTYSFGKEVNLICNSEDTQFNNEVEVVMSAHTDNITISFDESNNKLSFNGFGMLSGCLSSFRLRGIFEIEKESASIDKDFINYTCNIKNNYPNNTKKKESFFNINRLTGEINWYDNSAFDSSLPKSKQVFSVGKGQCRKAEMAF